MVRDVLQRVDKSNFSDLKTWLQDLQAIADEADDLLEEVAYENLRRQLEHPMRKKVRSFSLNPIAFYLAIGWLIKLRI